MVDEAAKFWSAFEKETGEKIEARSEGKWFRLPEKGSAGLLILTDKSFRFKYVPDTSGSFMGTDISPELEDRAEFTIPRGDIVSVSLPKRGFFAWLARRPFPRCSIVARSASGEKTYVFSADPSGGLIAALEKTWHPIPIKVVH
jgi:hypothetical protein